MDDIRVGRAVRAVRVRRGMRQRRPDASGSPPARGCAAAELGPGSRAASTLPASDPIAARPGRMWPTTHPIAPWPGRYLARCEAGTCGDRAGNWRRAADTARAFCGQPPRRPWITPRRTWTTHPADVEDRPQRVDNRPPFVDALPHAGIPRNPTCCDAIDTHTTTSCGLGLDQPPSRAYSAPVALTPDDPRRPRQERGNKP